jgi:hypothetical protein
MCTVRATFAAVDDPAEVANAIGAVFESLIVTSTWRLSERARREILYDPLDDLPSMDPRVHIKTPWTYVDDYTAPRSIFDVAGSTS